MSIINAAKLDKKLIAHLSHGGDIDDAMSSLLITELVRESLENVKIARAVRHHGLSNEILVGIYRESFKELLPCPLISHGGPILAPSLLFIDDTYLPKVLDLCVSQANIMRGIIDSQDFSKNIIIQTAVDFIVGLRDHGASKGKIMPWPQLNSPTLDNLERKKGCGAGCLGLFLFLASLGGGAITIIKQI